jgi:hypothetical protein
VFNDLQDKETSHHLPSNTAIYLLILILVATCFGPSEHHLAILQNFNLGTCSAVM